MFRKSLQILVGACLLTLAAIVGFAALRLTGPDDALAEAARRVQRREFARAVSELDVIEPELASDAMRTERLLRLRLSATKELGNNERALRDVERLLRMQVADSETLRLDEIWLLARSGNGAAARAASDRFLTDNPGHARGLELAGETCQLLYQPTLVELMERLQRELPAAARAAARTAAWSFLYRPDGDPEIDAALETLAGLHANTRLELLWRTVQVQLKSLRDRVQEALGFFRRSLEAPGEPVAAFRAFVLSLDQARRIDDLLIACEIQRHRFGHKFVDEAGADATWALLRELRPAAALATAERWLPPGTVAQRAAAKELGDGTLDLMAARAWAVHLCDDHAAAGRLWDDAGPVSRVKPPPIAWPFACFVLQLHNWDKAKEAEAQLDWALTLLANVKVPVDRLDMVPRIAGLWIELLQKRNAGDAAVQAVFRRWRALRPDTLEPLLAEADVAQAAGRSGVAANALEEARKLAPADDALLERYLALHRELAKSAGEDGESLLAQCGLRGLRTPQVRHPIGFLLCGEAALAHGLFQIAEACAIAAIEAFPLAREPRHLRVRTLVAQRRFDDALRHARALLDELPPTRETVELALTTARAAERDDRELLARALTGAGGGPVLQLALLDAAFASSPATAIAFAVPATKAPDAPRALQLAAARALALGGDPAAAGAMLDRLAGAPETSDAPRGALAAALAAYIVASSEQLADAELLALAEPRLQAAEGIAGADGRALLAAARTLADSHPRCALLLAQVALACSDPAERHGADFALAGDLAMRAGRWQTAEQAWTAALAFADGASCAEPLLRLCLAQGRPERAQQVRAFVDRPSDPAIALRLGELAPAAALVGAELVHDRADLLAHCLLALVGQSALVDWPSAEGAELANRAELLSLLREPTLAPFARERLEAMVAAEPRSRTNRLLLARAYVHSGAADKASALHEQLARERGDDTIVWREAALATRTRGYTIAPPLRLAIMGASTADQLATSPATLSYALEQWEAGLREHGKPDEADAIHLQLWRQAPTTRTLTAAELQFLADKLPPFDAWQILDQALDVAPKPRRATAIDRLQELAVVCAANVPSSIESLVATAKRLLASDGARGSLVHFLIDRDPALASGDRLALLRQHLAAVASGRDGDAFLGRTLQRLQELQGRNALVADIEAQLRATPTHLGLWLERTRLLAGSAHGKRAIADLRMVLAHAQAPALQVEALAFAAEAATVVPGDVEALQALPEALRDSPLGKYAAALMAMRAGRADQALEALAQAPARPDGMHLYALAMAALRSSAADGRERALAALRQLHHDYASSSLARNAGSFAIQLALP